MAGKGLISEFYQSFLGQVNKEKRCFPADDGIVVNVTLIGHIGRVRSVFLRQNLEALRPSAHRRRRCVRKIF
jgi:hypothetical protein